TPEAQRPAVVLVPRSQTAGAAPQGEKGTSDLSACFQVGLIMRPIQTDRSSVLFADRVNMSGIAQGIDVGVPQGRGEGLRRSAPVRQRVVYHSVRCGQDESFWQRLGLREQGERPKGERKPGVCAIPDLQGRHYVEHGDGGDNTWIV